MMSIILGVLFNVILTVLAAWVVCTLDNYCVQKRIKKRLAENDIIIQLMAKSLLEQKLEQMEKEMKKRGE